MQRTASTFLIFGILILLLGLVMAVSAAMPGKQPAHVAFSGTSNSGTCLHCHEDAHSNWLALPTTSLPTNGEMSTAANPLNCINCHPQQTNVPADELIQRLEITQGRVNELRANLAHIRSTHPHWKANITRSEKPNTQITAERIDTLLTFIEADGSWGFHRPDYTDDLLTEAETLMADLLKTLETK
jgi:hypothetical protein